MRLLLGCLLALVAGTTEASAKKHHVPPAPADPLKPPKPHHSKAWPLPAAGPTMSGDPELIFTFDDGPNPKTTPIVLDALAAHHIHAVFFLVGEMAANKTSPALIARMLRDGHIIANHTMTHQNLCQKDETVGAREIDEGKATIEKAANGYTTVWFRTPYGVRCERVESLLAERHLEHFHWDLDPQEWKHNNTRKAIDYVEKQVGKMTGRNVLLMHDIKKATAESLPVILDWLDTENASRKTEHKRRIRIVQSWELAIERFPPGLADWLADATPDPHVFSSAIANLLP